MPTRHRKVEKLNARLLHLCMWRQIEMLWDIGCNEPGKSGFLRAILNVIANVFVPSYKSLVEIGKAASFEMFL